VYKHDEKDEGVINLCEDMKKMTNLNSTKIEW